MFQYSTTGSASSPYNLNCVIYLRFKVFVMSLYWLISYILLFTYIFLYLNDITLIIQVWNFFYNLVLNKNLPLDREFSVKCYDLSSSLGYFQVVLFNAIRFIHAWAHSHYYIQSTYHLDTVKHLTFFIIIIPHVMLFT